MRVSAIRFKKLRRHNKHLLVVFALGFIPGVQALENASGFQADDCGVGCGYTDSGLSAVIDFSKLNSTVSFETLSLNGNETLTANAAQAGSALLINVRGNLPSNIYGTIVGVNTSHVVLANTNGIVFDGARITDINQIVATTGSVNGFSGTGYTISDLAQGGQIDVLAGGLTSNAVGGQVALIGADIDIGGDITLTGSEFSAIAGASAAINFQNGLMQIDITEALASAQTAIEVSANSTVTATNIDLRAALQGDPLALAINQRGVLKATGISNEGGLIRIRADGARALIAGELDTRNDANEKSGNVELAANTVLLAGEIQSDTLDVEIGEAEQAGVLQLIENPQLTFNLNHMDVKGSGTANQIKGLANYNITADDAGTASFEGIGTGQGDFSNVSAITFSSVSNLSGAVRTENTMIIGENGSLSGTLSGSEGDDTFLVQGLVERIDGLEGDDTVTMDGGIAQFIDGGTSKIGDQLLNVENPEFNDPLGLSGSGTNAISWVNFENVTEAVSSSDPEIVDEVNVPLGQPVDISSLQSVALGLTGDGNNLRLPCGVANAPDIPAADPEIDCTDKYNSLEYQQLISSLIHFANDSSTISAASATRLDKIANFFIDSGRFEQLQLSGHTDSNASEAYNLRLSERRVASTSNFLQQKGIGEEAIEGFAFGESLPAKPNTTAENLAYNRRVHIELK